MLAALLAGVAAAPASAQPSDKAAAKSAAAGSGDKAGGKPAGKPPGFPVRAAPVRVGTVASEITAVGSLIANESVIVRPEVAGRITEMPFAEGQPVARGARLVVLDASEIRAQIEATRADLLLNQQRFERADELFKKNFISPQALDEARSALSRSTARLREDEARLARMEIRAPFAGVIGLRLVSIGAYLKAGDDVVRLESLNPVKLDVRVPEAQLSRVKRDQAVAVRVDAYPDEPFAGRIYAIEPVVDDRTRTVLLRAVVRNDGLKLRPGMFARVSLVVGTREGAVLVPEEAIVPRGSSTFVFRIVEGKADLVEVVLGSRRPGEVEVLKGLGPSDRVVTDGHQKLGPGMPVIVTGAPAAKPSAPRAPAAK
jgi:membrane fusion protein (multidrug efflux system)